MSESPLRDPKYVDVLADYVVTLSPAVLHALGLPGLTFSSESTPTVDGVEEARVTTRLSGWGWTWWARPAECPSDGFRPCELRPPPGLEHMASPACRAEACCVDLRPT